MGKALVAAAVALVLGAVGGALALQTRLDPQLHEMETSLAKAREDARNATQRAEASGDRVDALQADLYSLEDERAELLARLRSLETAAPALDPAGELEYFEQDAFVDAWDAAASEAEPGDEDDDRDDRRRRDWGNDEERRQAFEERRVQMEEFRARIDAQIQAEITKLGPEFGEHFAAIQENRAYAEELRGQLRDAETDEEREAIIAEMRTVSDSNRQMMNDVQNAMLRDFAQSHNGAEDIKNGRYVRDLRELLGSPVFTMEGMFAGGGPRGGWGGPGGGRGGFSGGRGASGR
jgi:hypothetical protein